MMLNFYCGNGDVLARPISSLYHTIRYDTIGEFNWSPVIGDIVMAL